MSVQVIPDIETLVVTFLSDHADVSAVVDGRVSTRLPANPVLPALRVQRIGGTQFVDNYADNARIQVDAWAEVGDETTAWEAAATAEAALIADFRGSYDGAVVNTVMETLGLFGLPDPVTARQRYLFEVRVTYHVGEAS